MSRKARHNRKIRARILAAAAVEFRTGGFERARIDALMARAGLTRGAFYAHFSSKAALFRAAIAEQDLLAALLRGRSDAAPGALPAGLAYILRALLAPERQGMVAQNWGLATLMRDAALGDRAARDAYETAARDVLAEMARGLRAGPDDARLEAALCMTCGAVAMAAACASEEARSGLLAAASAQVSEIILEIHPD